MRRWIIYHVAFLLIVSSDGYSETLRAVPSNNKLETGSSFSIKINIPDPGNDPAPPQVTLDGNAGIDPLILPFIASAYANQYTPETGNIDFFQLPVNDESEKNDTQPDHFPSAPLAVVPPLIGLLIFGADTGGSSNPSVTVSPIPPTMILFGAGLIGFIGLRKRFRK